MKHTLPLFTTFFSKKVFHNPLHCRRLEKQSLLYFNFIIVLSAFCHPKHATKGAFRQIAIAFCGKKWEGSIKGLAGVNGGA